MHEDPNASDIASLDLFAGLDAATRRALVAEFETIALQRGEVLLRQGDLATDLFIVLSGRFAVTRDDRDDLLNDIGPGQPIGEIAFFAGGTRTATVTATRDSHVLRLGRAEYDRLAATFPALPQAVAVLLARRLGDFTAGRVMDRGARPRTIVVVPLTGPEPAAWLAARLAAALATDGATVVLDEAAARAAVGGADIDSGAATEQLNALERRYAQIVYLAGSDVSAWSMKAIRQADLALLVADHAASDATTAALERQVAALLPPARRRLVLLHPTRHDVQSTRRWLAGRDVVMHHHVARDETESVERLARFIAGTARGLVAGGGGAFCMAHAGVYKALLEAGHRFDMMGGTSGGSAMTAGFAAGIAPDTVDRMVAETFVTRKAMRRYTVPRYGLIDHVGYDRELQALFGARDVEDLWLPYFAVATNLSTNRIEVIRSGPLWQAVRASGSIPVLLPPFYTSDGQMLVDGGLIDNVPIKVMRDLKRGPNVVMSLEAASLARFDVDYAALPARRALLRALVDPWQRRALPAAPGIPTVLLRTLVAHRRDYERHLGPDDMHLKPPLPPGMKLLDWHRHAELFQSAYLWTRQRLGQP